MDVSTDLKVADSESCSGNSDSDLAFEVPDCRPETQLSYKQESVTDLNTGLEDNLIEGFGEGFGNDHQGSDSSLITVDTEIVAARTSPNFGRIPRIVLHEEGINVNGRLAIEASRYANWTDMEAEEGPTQKATQDYVDPRRLGLSSISMKDEADIICILQPTNPAAFEVVKVVAAVTPQHILHNQGLSCLEEDNLEPDTLDYQEPQRIQPYSADLGNEIALRISSKVKDECMGFVFGRDPAKSDIVIDYPDENKRVSGMHFRIFVNMGGIIMLEDTSTNGTMVEGKILKHDPRDGNNRPRHMVSQGSTIQLLLGARGSIVFTVKVLDRDQGVGEYNKRLGQYLRHIEEEKVNRLALLTAKATASITQLPVVQQGRETLQAIEAPTHFHDASNTMLTAGSVLYHHGSHWNGGEKYNVVSHIGKGAFADVFKFATKREGNVFAVKQLEKARFMKNGNLDQKFLSELRIMEMIDHPHIIKFIEYNDRPEYLFIIMEFIQHGDMMRYLKRCNTLSEPKARSVTRQICHALRYLHNCRITHRDIKPDNILIFSLEPFIVKLSDFGLSKVITNEETFLKTFCGTLLYCAPEVYPEYAQLMKGARKRVRHSEATNRSPYSSAVDLWSLAAVVFHLMTDEAPYKGTGENRGGAMVKTIIEGSLDITPLHVSGISLVGITFLQRLLRLDPAERLTASECLGDPWIRDVLDVIEIDVNEDDAPQALEAIQEEIEEEEEVLDASQLRLDDGNDPTKRMDSDSDEEVSDVDEIDYACRSKRLKVHRDIIVANHMQPSVGAFLGPILPIAGRMSYKNMIQSPTNRLFGEIGVSDLRSSGVLSHGANAALQILSPENRESERSFDEDDASEIDSNLAPSHNLHRVTAAAQQCYQQPIGSAPSLFGTEAQIRQFHMGSPESTGSVPATPQTPTTPMSRHASRSSSFALTSSKNQSRAMEAESDDTPKRPRLASPESSPYWRGCTDASNHNLGLGSRDSLRDFVQEQDDHAIANASLANTTGTIHHPSNLVTNDRSSIQITRRPLHLGKLVPIFGSIIQTSLSLTAQHMSYGRDPQSTYVYPDCMDTRIPKSAMTVNFWRPGIEDDIKSGGEWYKTHDPDLRAIITTYASKGIKVNGIVLPNRNSKTGCWLYGILHHGDIITIYESDSEFLSFRCEFYVGLSSYSRATGDLFVAHEEVEKYQEFVSRQASPTDFDNNSSAFGRALACETNFSKR